MAVVGMGSWSGVEGSQNGREAQAKKGRCLVGEQVGSYAPFPGVSRLVGRKSRNEAGRSVKQEGAACR